MEGSTYMVPISDCSSDLASDSQSFTEGPPTTSATTAMVAQFDKTCEANSPKSGSGRPTKLTPEVMHILTELLDSGIADSPIHLVKLLSERGVILSRPTAIKAIEILGRSVQWKRRNSYDCPAVGKESLNRHLDEFPEHSNRRKFEKDDYENSVLDLRTPANLSSCRPSPNSFPKTSLEKKLTFSSGDDHSVSNHCRQGSFSIGSPHFIEEAHSTLQNSHTSNFNQSTNPLLSNTLVSAACLTSGNTQVYSQPAVSYIHSGRVHQGKSIDNGNTIKEEYLEAPAVSIVNNSTRAVTSGLATSNGIYENEGARKMPPSCDYPHRQLMYLNNKANVLCSIDSDNSERHAQTRRSSPTPGSRLHHLQDGLESTNTFLGRDGKQYHILHAPHPQDNMNGINDDLSPPISSQTRHPPRLMQHYNYPSDTHERPRSRIEFNDRSPIPPVYQNGDSLATQAHHQNDGVSSGCDLESSVTRPHASPKLKHSYLSSVRTNPYTTRDEKSGHQDKSIQIVHEADHDDVKDSEEKKETTKQPDIMHDVVYWLQNISQRMETLEQQLQLVMEKINTQNSKDNKSTVSNTDTSTTSISGEEDESSPTTYRSQVTLPPVNSTHSEKLIDEILNDCNWDQWRPFAGAPRLAIKLARDCVFGTKVLTKSTVTGRSCKNALDKKGLDKIKDCLHRKYGSRCSQMEFEMIWKLSRESISQLCKRLRRRMSSANTDKGSNASEVEWTIEAKAESPTDNDNE